MRRRLLQYKPTYLPICRDPYARKCAFDVGDYGLGYCTTSLSLGCDCLGHIKYFDGVLCNTKGEPTVVKNAICMHEEVRPLTCMRFALHPA